MWYWTGIYLWRGSLLPLGRAAALKPAISVCQAVRIHRFYDCFAAEREQAPSPQKPSLSQIALWVFSQPNPASVVVSGLYSQPTQPW
ncbi:hypothetical protein PS723_02873 [Pseudomonas fluorescens]|uniref:Uncharacterized protein n=1 Tax=Pseudomonas fluorescens TaxID=294 RepID=A0A5E7CI74_PSEFL|nr:hypothetical protein PS723_02873 [Pseudomonas fluorescens]